MAQPIDRAEILKRIAAGQTLKSRRKPDGSDDFYFPDGTRVYRESVNALLYYAAIPPAQVVDLSGATKAE